MKTYVLNGLLILAVCLSSACTEKTLNENSNAGNDSPALSTSDILHNLGDSFRADAGDPAGMSLRSASSVANFVYPDYYGGGYVDDEDRVVVFVKGKPEDFVDEFQQRAGSKDVIVLSCEYSYNEMVALVDSLYILFLDDALCDELGWTGIAIDTKKNRVLIDLLPLTERAKRRFRERICRSGVIEFQRGGIGISDASANLAGSVSYLKYGASIGYRAKNSKGASGFVTAGHLVPKVGGPIFINGSYGADCKNTQHSGNIDAAFCQLRKGYSVSNRTEYGHVTVKAKVFSLANTRNMKIAMEGRSTAAVSHGVIKSTNAICKFKNRYLPGIGYVTYTISNMIFSTYPSKNGDSGGIVYGESSNDVVGIHSGRLVENNQFKGSYTIYAEYINQAFNLTLE